MNTKTCKKCGWVYPKVTPYTSCRFCGLAFTNGTCKKCGEYTEDLIPGNGLCRTCYNKRHAIYQKKVYVDPEHHNDYRKRLYVVSDNKFAEWTARLKSIKTHTLTEDEWMEACRYFKGCALCNIESIDARGYFVRFEDGGKYNACNVIPLCDKCATELKYQHNPFRRINTMFNSSLDLVRGISTDKLNKAADYLQRKMEGAENEQSSKNSRI